MSLSPIKFGSVCSGIGAPEVAWRPLGWHSVFTSEIEPFPRAVLAHHYPDIPCHGDFTTIAADSYGPIDLLVGGTPCQDFSIAGLRAGLAGDRGGLTLEFARLAQRLRPRWLVWENVPCVLSSDEGRAFRSYLELLAECGYGFAYRILDAQFSGVPQRRRRVWLVGYLGDWRPAAAVLAEPESLSGHPAPSRDPRANLAGTIGGTSPGGGWRLDADEAAARHVVAAIAPSLTSNPYGDHESREGLLVAFGGNDTRGPIDVATARNACKSPSGRMDFESETFVCFDSRQDPNVNGNIAGALGVAHPQAQAIAYMPARTYGADGGVDERFAERTVCDALHTSSGNGNKAPLIQQSGVRRLTPLECERLMGLPDNYTAIPMFRETKRGRVPKWRRIPADEAAYYASHGLPVEWYEGKKRHGWRTQIAADGPRYAACGNSMVVNELTWIGQRIELVEASLNHQRAAA